MVYTIFTWVHEFFSRVHTVLLRLTVASASPPDRSACERGTPVSACERGTPVRAYERSTPVSAYERGTRVSVHERGTPV